MCQMNIEFMKQLTSQRESMIQEIRVLEEANERSVFSNILRHNSNKLD